MANKWVKSVVMFTDGASRGNPGPASIGVLFTNTKGTKIDTISEAIGFQTNNFAEYLAVVEGLKTAIKNKVTELHLKSDSEFLIKQLKGEYKVKSETILPLYEQTKALLKKIKTVKLEHVRREYNKEADRLANKALDSGQEVMDVENAEPKQMSFDQAPQKPKKKDLGNAKIIAATESHINGVIAYLDEVAKEDYLIGMVKAPTIEDMQKRFKRLEEKKFPHYVIVDGENVVGSGDVQAAGNERHAHVGWLGMGMKKSHRGRGLGEALLRKLIEGAKNFGFERIFLDVYASNEGAVALYEKLGFVQDGLKKKASKWKGRYEDHVLMTLEL